MRGLAFTLLLSAVAAPVAAQPDARDVTVARREFQAGVQAARTGDWATARDHFARSYEINPRVSALFNLAGAQTRTGELVASAESYREYLGRRDEAPAANIAEAERLLAELEAKIPTLRLTVENVSETDEIVLDEHVLQPSLLDAAVSQRAALPIDPGDHVVTIRRDGAEVAREAFTAAEGARLSIGLSAPTPAVEPPPVPDLSVPPPEPTPRESSGTDLRPAAAAATTPPDDDSGSVLEKWWFWTIIGAVVVAGVVIGVVAGTSVTEAPLSRGFQSPVPVEVP